MTLTSANSETPAAIYVVEMIARGFRGLGDCAIEFEPDLTLLVGRNNAGKSRLLRALAVGLGVLPADRDDWTVGSSQEPTIDIVVAPRVRDGDIEEFDDRVRRRLERVQPVSEDPLRERFAWRTTIRPSAEGFGVRTEHVLMLFDQTTEDWEVLSPPTELSRRQRSLLEAELVDSRRDLVEDMGRRGSAIRRILDDLEVPEERRVELEQQLATLGRAIVTDSVSLASVQKELETLSALIDSVGKARIQPVPQRLEELSRTVSIEFDTGGGNLPMRFHGSGPRSLAALQTQAVFYARRLGRDGPALLPHPLSLIEEPEAHLHPQAQFDLQALLAGMRGQIVASTHSSHLVSVVEPRAIRLLQADHDSVVVRDLRPHGVAKTSSPASPIEQMEMEKLRRLVERPFGELLFSSAVVLGDGASERALLPPLLRHRLGVRSHGVCVVDPGSLNTEYATAVVKFANRIGVPWLLYADSDSDGRRSATRLVDNFGRGDMTHIVWVSDPEPRSTEGMLLEFDRGLCEVACEPLGFQAGDDIEEFMKDHKGTYGRFVADELIAQHPWPEEATREQCGWPASLAELCERLSEKLARRPTNAS